MVVYLMDTRCFADKELFAEIYGTLSPVRKKKIDAYMYDKDKYLSMGAGYLLENGLKAHALPPQQMHYEYGRDGKPGINDPRLRFNISHSGVFTVCAFSGTEIGIDLQQMTKRVNPTAFGVACSPKEKKYLKALDRKKWTSEFYRMWTIKESYMKFLGTGLSLAPSRVDVNLEDFPLSVSLDGKKQNTYFKEYDVGIDYKLTVCSGRNDFAPNITVIRLDRYHVPKFFRLF